MSSLPGTMTKFRIDELSGVDRPAQKGARAVLMKRDGKDGAAPAVAKAGNGEADSTEEPMSSEIKKALGLPETATEAEVAAAITKAQTAVARITEVESELAIAKGLAGMTDAERVFYADLAKADKAKADAFMAGDAKTRDAEMKKAAALDETVVVEGRTISKRAVGEDTFEIFKAQAKRLDDQAAEIKKAAEANETAGFTKRATDDYGHLAGSVEDRVAVLRHLAKADEPVRKAAETLLKAAEAAAAFAFTRRGSGGPAVVEKGADGLPVDAEAKLNALAKKAVEADSTLSFAKAYDKVAMENPQLYDEVLNGKPDA